MKKILRAFLTLMLSMLFCIPVLNVVFAETGADTEAPLVTSATFVTKTVSKPTDENSNTNAQIKLSVEEEGTGINKIQVGIYVYKNGNSSPMLIFANESYVDDKESLYSGDITINVPICKSDASGVYKLGYIRVSDNAGNAREYFDHYNKNGYSKDGNSKEYLKCIGANDATNACYIEASSPTLTVKSNGDDTAPIVTSAKVLTTSVERPNSIKVELEVIEESAINSVSISYSGKKKNEIILVGNANPTFSVSGNKVSVDLETRLSDTAGTYYIEKITIVDSEGNSRTYLMDVSQYKYFSDENGFYLEDAGNPEYKCYVVNGQTIVLKSNGDDLAPIISKVSVGKDTVKKPGILPITIDLQTADEVSSVTIRLNKYKGTEDEWIAYGEVRSSKEKIDKIEIKMPIATATEMGVYYIEQIEIIDWSGNKRVYFDDVFYMNNKYSEENGKAYLPDRFDSEYKAYLSTKSFIEIEDEFDIVFEVGLSNSKLVSKINNMSEGETGKVFIDGKGIAKAEIFEAIKGKDKTIIFYNDNYQWVFNGKDVKNVKDIRLKIEFSMVAGSEYDLSGNLLKIVFPANGELPGKANVRIKSDYTYQIYEMTEAMYLYFLNENSDKLEYQKDSDIAYVLDGTDHWCKFDITHNSTYMVSNTKLVKAKKLTITADSNKLAAGKKMKLSVTFKPANVSNKAVKWTVSNKKYATVNSKGVVTAKKAGIGKKVTITATAKDGSKKKAKFTITIMKDSVKSIKLKAVKSIKAGKSVTVKATVKTTGKKANKKLKWTTSNKKYATVNSKGKVVTKKAGKGKTVKITAKATDGSGKKATITIKIK